MAYTERLRGGITPAYAGSTSTSSLGRRSTWDHPRIRGEHYVDLLDKLIEVGSPPHTRGAPGTPRPHFSQYGDHPRIRGEHIFSSNRSNVNVGSPPHTRGALSRFTCGGVFVGITPAYAGSTGCRCLRSATRRDHPRIRGEHLDKNGNLTVDEGSPPHTRGAPYNTIARTPEHGITPAYAGSTFIKSIPSRDVRDHPRIRGEH